jgi:hypothetical protein
MRATTQKTQLTARQAFAILTWLCAAIAAPTLPCRSALGDDAGEHSAIPPTAVDAFVVPPGQENLLADMLGRGAALPGECQLSNGDINGPVVAGTYTCATGQVIFELRHPDQAPADVPRTDKFAVVLKSGTPPAGLSDALLASIKSHEAQFKWLSLLPPKPPSRGFLGTLLPVLAVAAVIFVLRRLRRARRAG